MASERQRIAEEIDRVTGQNLDDLNNAQLLLARNDARQVLNRIDQYRNRLQKKGAIAARISGVNDAMTVISGAVWGATLMGVAVAPVLATAAAIATPLGAAYIIGDRVRLGIRKRRLATVEIWYRRTKDHVDDIERRVVNRLLNPPPPSDS